MAILTAIVSVVLGYLTYLSSRRATAATTRVEMSKVDAEAYLRAQKIYDGTIEVLRRDNERLTVKIASLEAKIDRLEAAIHAQTSAIRDVHDQTDAILDKRDEVAHQRDVVADRRDEVADRRQAAADRRDVD